MATKQDAVTMASVEQLVDEKIKNIGALERKPEIFGTAYLEMVIDAVRACCQGHCPCNPKCVCKARSDCGCRGLCSCKGHTVHTPPHLLEGSNLDPADVIMSVPIEDLQSLRDVIDRVREGLEEKG